MCALIVVFELNDLSINTKKTLGFCINSFLQNLFSFML